MPTHVPPTWISYKNDSGEDIPAFAPIQLSSDCEVNDDTGVITPLAVKPDGSGPYALNNGFIVADGQFGECQIAVSKLAWARYTSDEAPSEPWLTEVGPKVNDWDMEEGGDGFIYAGLHEPDNDRILVKAIVGGGGATAEGRLTSSVTPATNSLTGATTFTFRRFVKDSSIVPQTDPATLKEEVDSDNEEVQTTGVNRSTKLSANSGGYVICVKVNGEFKAVWVEDECPD